MAAAAASTDSCCPIPDDPEFDPEFDDGEDLCNGGGGGPSGARNFVKSGGLIIKRRNKVNAYYINYLTRPKFNINPTLVYNIILIFVLLINFE